MSHCTDIESDFFFFGRVNVGFIFMLVVIGVFVVLLLFLDNWGDIGFNIVCCATFDGKFVMVAVSLDVSLDVLPSLDRQCLY